ncbi:alpha-(1-_3)-arabinofuranosyltransferase family protein [Janibacter limosus]|uniref:alpha-(1->3)-arabinofuranosyltransferase domain-containing protein n=1 Tax=Janibacter limosus TaxID=53458 RepID=UPI0035DF8B87|nr:alpha-(1->3)-arabinofuranosyltransferase family protein [Janibacter limosus]
MRSRLRLPRVVSGRVVTPGLVVVPGVIVFANSWGVFQTDIKPEVYLAPGEMLPGYLAARTSSPYLGSPNFNVGLVPVLLVTAALRAIGLDPEMAFKVYHLILWVLAAWGTNRLLRTLVPSASAWAGLLAGVAYIANPYAVAGGSTPAIALPMALLPWLLVAMTRALRDPLSWAWPAGVALVFFGMSGMNVGVVPVYQLLLVIPLALYVRSDSDLTWRQIAVHPGRCALFVVLVSLYWLVPGAAASGTGSQIAEGSETLDGIARTSSFVEVLRGLGLWSYYGSSDAGPWLPQYAMYFTSSVIILLTMVWPAAALLALKVVPARPARFSAVAAAMVAVVMVGLYPGGNGSSPFAVVLRWLFDHVGPLIAFRTTNKIGAGLALAFALLLGLALVRVLPRVLRGHGRAPLTAGAGTAVVLALVAPAVTGNLYVSPLDVPDYWREAATAIDRGNPDQRVPVLPGQTRSSYRWSPDRPDDLPNSLFTHDAVIPETIPNTSQSGGNFPAALDSTLQSGTAGTRDISPFARYLGAAEVLLRHDVVWEDTGGARPGSTARAPADDPGLQGLRNFGTPGHNMFTRANPPLSREEAVLTPLQLYGVHNSQGMVRATSASDSLVVAGDARAIPALQQEGLLDGSPAIRYARGMTGDQLRTLLSEDGRMVVTDTNQRRAAITNRLTSNEGAILSADETPKVTRTLGDDPRDQSTLVREGIRATASSAGGAFFDPPHGVAENAVDGDPATSWLFGDFRRAKGESLTLSLPKEQRLGRIEIDTTALGDVRIDRLDVRAGDARESVEVAKDGTAVLNLGGATSDRVKITVGGIRGQGFSLVGISEVTIGGVSATAERTTRVPDTLTRLYGELSPAERQDFADRPLDILFSRVKNTDAPDDDTEQGLRRDFTVPDDRTYRAEAQVRALGPREVLADELAGLGTTYRARSNRTYFDSLTRRASKAADSSSASAWVPGGDITDGWWEISGPERNLSEVTVTQAPGPGDEGDTARVTRASVVVDGTKVASGPIGQGTSSIDLPPGTRGSKVRITLDEVDDSAGSRPARFTTIDTGARITRDAGADRCVTVATLDGKPVTMRPDNPEAIAGPGDPATTWTGCDKESVVWGEHQLRPVDGLQLDRVSLNDVVGTTSPERVPAPVVEVRRSKISSSMKVSVGAASTPYFLSIGRGHDPRWKATPEDGTDPGPPVVVNGYAAGWYVDDLGEHTVTVAYGPQRSANIALGLSVPGLLLCTILFFVPVIRRRVTAIRTQRESEWEEPVASPAADETEPDETEPAATEPAHATPDGATAAGSTGTAVPEQGDAVPEQAAVDDPRPVRPVSHALGDLLTGLAGRRRLALEAAIVVGAAALTGIGGGLAAPAAMLLVRRSGPRAGLLITVGAGLARVAAVAFIVQSAVADTLGTVSADAVKAALVPHHIAGAGLVLAVLGTFMRHDPPEEQDT